MTAAKLCHRCAPFDCECDNAPAGWQCPLCRVVHAPSVTACRCANAPARAVTAEPLQARIQLWATACFGEAVAADKLERSDRLLEEVFELLQAAEYPRERVAQLASYVWSRPSGAIAGEIGDVMICIATFASAYDIDLDATADTALARCWANIEKTRAKRAAKPIGSALPQVWAQDAPAPAVTAEEAAQTVGDNPSSQEVLAVLWEWTDGEFAGGRYWGCHSVGGDGRIQQWQEIGARPLGAAVVTVTEGEGLHLLTTTPAAQEGGDA
ncbi:MAG: hypothetical protein ACU0A5_21715 [Salipiger marinus]|uniref:hypothetical protein n=1 Tax=Salipiger marinus TaxID=555512 RepID=UPI00405849FE